MHSFTLTYPQLRVFLDGMLAMMAFYALFSFFQHRKAIYWQYSLYIICMVFTFYLDDIDYQQEANYKPGANFAVAFVESLAFLLYIRFAIMLIDIPRLDPLAHRLLQFMTRVLYLEILLDISFLIGNVPDTIKTTNYIIFRAFLAIGALVVVPRILRLHQAAIAYFIAGSFFFVMGCVVALSINYISFIFTRNPYNPFTFPVTYIEMGVIFEVLCFALGMSVRNRQNESARIEAQAQLIAQLRENEKKQLALQRIRDDISRDLHDELGADLSSISAMSHAVARQLGKENPTARDTVKVIGETSRKVITRMREIIWSLHSQHDSMDHFAFRMKETAYALLEHEPIKLDIQMPPEELDMQMSNEHRRDFFLVYKEILHNIIRHANAKNVTINLSVAAESVALQVRDDGVGFDVMNAYRTGNGLSNLRQRTEAFKGSLLIDSQPGRGTAIQVLCPFRENVMSA